MRKNGSARPLLRYCAVAALCIASTVPGALAMHLWHERNSIQTFNAMFVYQSRVDDKTILGLRHDGRIKFGSDYERDTEAKKLVDMARQYLREGAIIDCHETGYNALRDGIRRVYPGTANAPDPIIGQGL